jgi:hypothetical protein
MKSPSLFLRIWTHVRKDGFLWTVKQSLRASGLQRIWALPGLLFRRGTEGDSDTLYAYYDLNVSPITYDALWFCLCAEMERREKGLKHLALVLVPTGGGDVREESYEYDKAVDRDKRIWRVYNVVIASMLMIRPEASVHVLRDVKDLRLLAARPRHVFPQGYSPFAFPKPVTYQDFAVLQRRLSARGLESFFSAGLAGRNYIQNWRRCFGARPRMVVVTLRNYGFASDRNSNIAAWLAFARELDPEKYTVVFVPDTDTAYDDHTDEIASEFLVFREAAFHPHLRAALYEAAFVNMATMAGPTSMITFNAHCRYLQFKPMVPSAAMSTREVLEEIGYKFGETPEFSTRYQKLVWEADDLEVLRREFRAFETLADETNLPDMPALCGERGRT